MIRLLYQAQKTLFPTIRSLYQARKKVSLTIRLLYKAQKNYSRRYDLYSRYGKNYTRRYACYTGRRIGFSDREILLQLIEIITFKSKDAAWWLSFSKPYYCSCF